MGPPHSEIHSIAKYSVAPNYDQDHYGTRPQRAKAGPAPLAEQKEIAEALDAVEQKAASHTRKHAALTALFRTLLYHLMTARLRVHDLDLTEFGLAQGGCGQPTMRGAAISVLD